jgi:hypothetical protein
MIILQMVKSKCEYRAMGVSLLVLIEDVLGDFESHNDESCLDESVEENLVPSPEAGSFFGRIDHKH